MKRSVFAHFLSIIRAKSFEHSSLPALAGASNLAKVFDNGRLVLDTPPSRGMTIWFGGRTCPKVQTYLSHINKRARASSTATILRTLIPGLALQHRKNHHQKQKQRHRGNTGKN
jgi:hypothetical protein